MPALLQLHPAVLQEAEGLLEVRVADPIAILASRY
jgi:hypothetical protein